MLRWKQSEPEKLTIRFPEIGEVRVETWISPQSSPPAVTSHCQQVFNAFGSMSSVEVTSDAHAPLSYASADFGNVIGNKWTVPHSLAADAISPVRTAEFQAAHVAAGTLTIEVSVELRSSARKPFKREAPINW